MNQTTIREQIQKWHDLYKYLWRCYWYLDGLAEGPVGQPKAPEGLEYLEGRKDLDTEFYQLSEALAVECERRGVDSTPLLILCPAHSDGRYPRKLVAAKAAVVALGESTSCLMSEREAKEKVEDIQARHGDVRSARTLPLGVDRWFELRRVASIYAIIRHPEDGASLRESPDVWPEELKNGNQFDAALEFFTLSHTLAVECERRGIDAKSLVELNADHPDVWRGTLDEVRLALDAAMVIVQRLSVKLEAERQGGVAETKADVGGGGSAVGRENEATYTIAEVCEMAGCQNDTLRTYAKGLELPTAKRGEKNFRYTGGQVRIILEAMMRRGTREHKKRCRAAIESLP